MTKHLFQHGNSLALIIDKPILKMLGIDKETSLQISIEGKKITITEAVTPKKIAKKSEVDEPKTKKTVKKSVAARSKSKKKTLSAHEKLIRKLHKEIVAEYAEDFKKLAKN